MAFFCVIVEDGAISFKTKILHVMNVIREVKFTCNAVLPDEAGNKIDISKWAANKDTQTFYNQRISIFVNDQSKPYFRFDQNTVQ